MNNLAFQKPTHIYWSNISEFGLGYNLWSSLAPQTSSGLSPVYIIELFGIPSLHYSTWVDDFHKVIPPESWLLSQTDSSSASGWQQKSNFADNLDEAIQLSAARKLSDLLINSESNLYSQWFPSGQNSMSNSLSRDFHVSSTNFSSLLYLNFPEQAPFGLTILPLPPKIVSWPTCLLCSQQLILK
jgi:hypothetical protein